ncbi:MAG UNVERIFIED_CONTAM: hypothetical protein LVQ98_08550 [Rickettsiaceae bacterium]|jgi:hypothetical protein
MQTRFWHPLKSVVKIYGMTKLGVTLSLIGCLISMMILGFMWSIAGAIPGYFIGDYLAKALHDGRFQRFYSWHFNSSKRKGVPPSSVKHLF